MALKQESVQTLIAKELHEGRGIEAIVQRFKNSVIVEALDQCDGNISHAAALMRTHRHNLERWMKEENIHVVPK